MDPPNELPLHGTHEELALDKINWLPEEKRRGDWRSYKKQVRKKSQNNIKRELETGRRRKKTILTEK